VTTPRWPGLLALAFFAIHAVWGVSTGRPTNMLWACHLAALGVGVGILARAPAVNALAVLWFCAGVPLWLFDVATGGELLPTSISTHAGGMIVGLWGVRALGMPRGVWWKAAIGVVLLQLVSRAVSDATENANLAYSVPAGWELTFPSHLAFLLLNLSCATATFAAGAPLLRWSLSRPAPAEAREARSGVPG